MDETAGPSTATMEEGRSGSEKRPRKRKASRSTSSGSSRSSSSSSTSSSSSSDQARKRKKRSKRKRKHDNSKLKKLIAEVSNLKHEMTRQRNSTPRESHSEYCSEYIDPNISGELFVDGPYCDPPAPPSDQT